jgi:hypothetical protein
VVVVECAVSVREQLKIIYCLSGGELEQKYDSFPIIYKGVNYLAKMNSDTVFLNETHYGKLFQISGKSDPFLLVPATIHIASTRNTKQRLFSTLKQTFIELPISISLLKRIKAADSILLKEKAITQGSALRSNRRRTPRDPSLKANTEKYFPLPIKSRISSRKSSHKVLVEVSRLCPLKIRDIDVARLVEWYKSKVSDSFAKSYCSLDDLLERSQAGHNPIWLGYSSHENAFNLIEAKHSFNIEGLAVIHIDPSSQLRTRVVILHASVIEDEVKHLSDFLLKLMDYIWTTINCDEVRVELLHFTQNDKLAPYELLKYEYQRLKFKWKTLINDKYSNRVLILGINRPEDKQFNKGLDCKNEPIVFKHGVVLTLTDKLLDVDNEELKVPKLYSLCSYLQVIKQFEEPNCYLSLSDEEHNVLIESLMKSIDKLAGTVIYIYKCREHYLQLKDLTQINYTAFNHYSKIKVWK